MYRVHIWRCRLDSAKRPTNSLYRLANPCHLEDAPMLYEVRTYTLRPGTVAEFEERFAKRLPLREKHSKLGAFWHTEFGPLNQVIHVYPYEDLQQRTGVRAAMAQDTALAQLPGGGDLAVSLESEIMNPAPFMHPLGSRDYGTGNVYEMRTYIYAPGDIPKVLDGWATAISAREQFSPLAACWTSELGGLNKFVHTWVYKDLNERARVREASRQAGGAWPPQTGIRPIRQTNKLLIPATFSPVR
jgi:NIPSNAP